jgi:hypothetical protein
MDLYCSRCAAPVQGHSECPTCGGQLLTEPYRRETPLPGMIALSFEQGMNAGRPTDGQWEDETAPRPVPALRRVTKLTPEQLAVLAAEETAHTRRRKRGKRGFVAVLLGSAVAGAVAGWFVVEALVRTP